MDDVVENKKALDKISENTVTSLDQKIEKEIDGVYVEEILDKIEEIIK